MKIVIVSLLLTFALAMNAQPATEVKREMPIPLNGIREDYSILREAFETTYPSLYRFTDSLIMTGYLDKQSKSLDRSMTEREFYRIIALTCARINDEHIIPTPSKDYYDSLKNSNHYFPFSLKIVASRLFIFKNYNLRNELPIGSEVLSINGHSVEEILNTLLPTIPSDGYIQTFNVRHLEDYSMTQNQNLFDLNYPIFFEEADTFRLEFIHPDAQSKKQTISIRGLDYKDYKKFYGERIGYRAPLEFKYLKDDIAYLRIASFLKYHREDFNQDLQSLYDSIFTQLNQRGTKNLILDLRYNEGGDGTGEKLLSYLLKRPYRHFSFTEEKFTGYPPIVDYLENGKDLFFVDSIVSRTKTGMFRLKRNTTIIFRS